MKRTAFKLIAFLLLGAVTTVAIAWGCAAWGQPPFEFDTGRGREKFGYSDDGVSYLVEGDTKAGIASYLAVCSSAGLVVDDVKWRRPRPPSWVFGVLERYVDRNAIDRGDGKVSGLLDIRASGWPMTALRSHTHVTVDEAIGVVSVPAFLGPGGSGDQHYLLPLLPVWGGFAFNTSVFAVVHAALAWMLSTSRRLRRFVRGCCPQCRYDLRADYRRACPECGWRRNEDDIQ